MSRQEELDADPKAIQQTEVVEKLKNVVRVNADITKNMFVLTKRPQNFLNEV